MSIIDPYKKVCDDVYMSYVTSTEPFYPYWRFKKIHCPVCNCYVTYPRSQSHIYTNKHYKNLKKL